MAGKKNPGGANNRHVVPNKERGGFDVVKPRAQLASSHHDRQRDAKDRARQIVGNLGGGEVIVHGLTGGIRDKDTVRPGRDPNPPKDREH